MMVKVTTAKIATKITLSIKVTSCIIYTLNKIVLLKITEVKLQLTARDCNTL